MSTIAANPCSVLQGLAYYQYQIISALNKKFVALQRLATLLEQQGDIGLALPTAQQLDTAVASLVGGVVSTAPVISQLAKVDDVTLAIYTSLQKNCPFLGLQPLAPQGTGSLNDLKAKLNAAYTQLLKQIKNHSYFRLNGLQAKLNAYQNKLNFPFGTDYVKCINAFCSAIAQAGSLLSNISQTDISAQLAAFDNNFVKNAGNVLTVAQQGKRSQAVNAYNQVLALKDSTVADYTSITAGGKQNPAPPAQSPASTTDPNFQYADDGEVAYPDG